MNIKRIACLVVALLMCMGLFAGCGGGEDTATAAPTAAASGAPASAAPATAAPAETKELLCAHDFAVDSIPLGKTYEVDAQFLSDATGGSLTIKQAGNGSIAKEANILESLMSGMVDMGHSLATTAAGTIPEMACLGIPGYFGGSDWLAFTEDVRQPLTDIYAKYGIHYFAANYQAFGTFVCTEHQITKPEDCKGLVIRASGNTLASAIENWGGSPTVITLGDVATALERSTIDALYTSFTLIGDMKFYELADYITTTPICETWGSTVMSQATYDSLSDEQKAAVDECAMQHSATAHSMYKPYAEASLQKMQDNGNSVYTLTDEEAQAFTSLCKPLFEDFGKNTTPEGLALLKVIYEHNGWEWTF